jgi:hypothetical protein
MIPVKRDHETEIVDPALNNLIANNRVVFGSSRRLRLGDQEYMTMGMDGDLVSLYNLNDRTTERITKEEYLQLNYEGLQYRVNVNGRDFDIDEDNRGRATLVDTQNRGNVMLVTQRQLETIRQQNADFIGNQLSQSIRQTNDSNGN